MSIVQQRLLNQHIAETTCARPEELVAVLGAMQAQEWAMVKWAIGLRIPGLMHTDIETAFNAGLILRTHLLRPTWHFACPADLRWLLSISAPRVHAANAYVYRQCALDPPLLARCADLIARALEGQRFQTRDQLKSVLTQAGIEADGLRLAYIFMHAELEAVICSGPRIGRQFTYALFDERVPPSPPWPREQALRELCIRYFGTRGPASIRDFVMWSGMTVKDAKAGIALLPGEFVQETIDGKEYVFVPRPLKPLDPERTTFLMPDYDEYGMSYKDRSAFIQGLPPEVSSLAYTHFIVLEGFAGGTWQRKLQGKALHLETQVFPAFKAKYKDAVARAVARYRVFFGEDSGE